MNVCMYAFMDVFGVYLCMHGHPLFACSISSSFGVFCVCSHSFGLCVFPDVPVCACTFKIKRHLGQPNGGTPSLPPIPSSSLLPTAPTDSSPTALPPPSSDTHVEVDPLSDLDPGTEVVGDPSERTPLADSSGLNEVD